MDASDKMSFDWKIFITSTAQCFVLYLCLKLRFAYEKRMLLRHMHCWMRFVILIRKWNVRSHATWLPKQKPIKSKRNIGRMCIINSILCSANRDFR